MVQPKPFKYVCPKCRHTKIVKPKSDALDPTYLMGICPECKVEMVRKQLGLFDGLLSLVIK